MTEINRYGWDTYPNTIDQTWYIHGKKLLAMSNDSQDSNTCVPSTDYHDYTDYLNELRRWLLFEFCKSPKFKGKLEVEFLNNISDERCALLENMLDYLGTDETNVDIEG